MVTGEEITIEDIHNFAEPKPMFKAGEVIPADIVELFRQHKRGFVNQIIEDNTSSKDGQGYLMDYGCPKCSNVERKHFATRTEMLDYIYGFGRTVYICSDGSTYSEIPGIEEHSIGGIFSFEGKEYISFYENEPPLCAECENKLHLDTLAAHKADFVKLRENKNERSSISINGSKVYLL